MWARRVLSWALMALWACLALAQNLKVEQVKKDVDAVQCGKAVLINYYQKLIQAPAPTGTNPETCEHFKMTMANLTEVHKEAFKDMVNLKSLQLWGNSLHKLHRDTFKDTVSLEHLMLGGNAFKTLPSGLFRNLQKLTFLDIYAQLYIDEFPDDLLEPLSSLQKLYVADVQLTNDKLNAGFLDGVADSIEHLSLGHNKLTRLPGDLFSKMTALTALSLAKNKISEITKADLEGLKNLKHMGTFHLKDNPIECCDRIKGLPEVIEAELKDVCPKKRCTDDDEEETKEEEELKEEKEEEKKDEAEKKEEEEKKEEKDEEKKEEKDEEEQKKDEEEKKEEEDKEKDKEKEEDKHDEL